MCWRIATWSSCTPRAGRTGEPQAARERAGSGPAGPGKAPRIRLGYNEAMTQRSWVRSAVVLALLLSGAAIPAASAVPVWLPPTEAGWPGAAREPGDLSEYLALHKQRAAVLPQAALVGPTSNQRAWDVTAYDLDLAADLANKVVTGSVRVRATVTAGPLLSMELDLADTMTVDSVRLLAGAALPFTHDNDLLTVTLDRAWLTGEGVDLTVWYHGTPDRGAFGSAFAFTTKNTLPMIWTLSEPYGAREWWPCKDHPEDKADSVSMRVTVPSGMKTVSNGVLVESGGDAAHAVTRWVERHPISTYLVSLASHPYTHATDWYVTAAGDSMPLGAWISPADSALAAPVRARVRGAVTAYAARFGEYPFLDEKYGEVQFSWGGGMEHQTITSIGSVTSEYLMVHELAHQWWGDWVTCRDFTHLWLNEGFATWSEALWAEAQGGMAAYHAEMAGTRYFGAGTIIVPEDATISRMFSGSLTYNKASWVPHMLRHVLGDTLFFQAVREYGRRHAYGTAVTEDFQAVCEEFAGRDLGAFFAEWIYGEYYPVYGYRWWSAPAAGGWDVSVFIAQSQDWQTFWMPVDVAVRTAGGTTTFVAWDSLPSQTFVFHVAEPPESVLIDPDEWILRTTGVLAVDDPAFPAAVALLAPRPNPARGRATLDFVLPRSGPARLEVYDVRGARVRTLADGTFPPGTQRVAWDGSDAQGRRAGPGVYLVRLEAAGQSRTQRLVLLR
jgi:aminopeptidase N